jgi:hypothetical protein
MQFGRNDIFELLCNVYSEYPSIFGWRGLSEAAEKEIKTKSQSIMIDAGDNSSRFISEYERKFDRARLESRRGSKKAPKAFPHF